MQFKVLGPLEAIDDAGGQIAVRGARRRALLIRLLVATNQVVSSDGLVEDVWDGIPPAGAIGTLQSHVSLLRRLVGDRLRSQPPGYILEVASDEVDVLRFETDAGKGRNLLSRGMIDGAILEFDRALKLWRGPALHDVEDMEFARREVTRLEQLRIDTVESQIEALLRIDNNHRAVAIAEEAVDHYPLRELLWSQLMIGLARQGRQADALRAYQRLRSHLGVLGIEPSVGVKEVEESILLQQPLVLPTTEQSGSSLILEPIAPSTVGITSSRQAGGPRFTLADLKEGPALISGQLAGLPRIANFVGRERERRTIEWVGETVLGDRVARAVFIAGTPGMGKTQLALAGVDTLVKQGYVAVTADCRSRPVTHCFGQVAAQLRSFPELADLVGPLADRLAALGLPVDRSEVEPVISAATIDIFGALVRTVTRHRPLLVRLENCQSADTETVEVLRGLLTDREHLPLVLLGEVDLDRLGPSRPLVRLLYEFRPQRLDQWLQLGGLSEDDAMELLGDGADEAAGRCVRQLVTETGGHPMLLREGVLRVALPSESRRVAAESAGQLFERWSARLGPVGRNILGAASLIGLQFDMAVLIEVGRRPEDETLELLEKATLIGLLSDLGRGRYTFNNEATRNAFTVMLSQTRRGIFHRRIAEALAARLDPVQTDGSIFAVVDHFQASEDGNGGAAGLACVLRAAEYAAATSQTQRAAHWYAVAVEDANRDTAVDPETRATAYTGLIEAKAALGDIIDDTLYAHALPATLASNRSDLRARNALAERPTPWGSSTPELLRQRLEDAIEVTGDDSLGWRARLLARLASTQIWSSDLAARTKLVDEAVALVTDADPRTTAEVLGDAQVALSDPSTLGRRLGLSNRCLMAARQTELTDILTLALALRISALSESGYGGGAADMFAELSELASDVDTPFITWATTTCEAFWHVLSGNAEQANIALEKMRDTAPPNVNIKTEPLHLSLWCLLARLEGRHRNLIVTMLPMVDLLPEVQALPAAVAASAARTGDRGLAKRIQDTHVASGFALPNRPDRITALLLWAETAIDMGDTTSAEQLYPLLINYADTVDSCPWSFAGGSVAMYLGGLASSLGDADLAEQHFLAAQELTERSGSVHEQARTQLWWARSLGAVYGLGNERSQRHARRAVELAPPGVTWDAVERARRFIDT